MLHSAIERILEAQGVWADPLGKLFVAIFAALYKPVPVVRDFLNGVWLGHPLHPALTDIPLGAWTVGVAADLLHYPIPALPTAVGDVGVGFGLIAGLGSALSGYTDHHETFGNERRVATMHGLLMTIVVVLMTVSVVLRWKAGVGGHLTFGIGTMVNHNAFAVGPEEAAAVGKAADFAEGSMKVVQAGDMPVLMTRVGGRLYAIANTCSHAGGPLNEGSLEGDLVTCPWHASRFCVRDGAVRGGPATFSQPALAVTEEHGQVKVKLAQPLH